MRQTATYVDDVYIAKGAWLGLPRSLSYLIDGSNKNGSTNNENECNSGNACLGGNNDGGNYDSNLRVKRVEKNEAEFNELPLKPQSSYLVLFYLLPALMRETAVTYPTGSFFFVGSSHFFLPFLCILALISLCWPDCPSSSRTNGRRLPSSL